MISSRPRWRRGLILFATLWSLVACMEPGSTRNIVAESWDTIFVLGTERQDDTTLIRPADLLLTRERLFVLEDLDQQVRAFDRATGDLEWTFGRRGQGPGEMAFAMKMFFDPSGDIRVWDSRNRKLLRISQDGTFKGEVSFPELWGLSDAPQGFGDEMIWIQLSPERPAYISSMEGGDPVDSVQIRWPIPEGLPYPPNLVTMTSGSSGRWVQGLNVGPFFAVGDAAGVAIFPMIDSIPYGYAAGLHLSRRDPTADSARWGVRDVAMTDDEIFILTGGRPPSLAHPAEPSRLVDVYRTDGTYLRSYFLPFEASGIATDDGRSLFLLPGWDEPFPRIIGLVPRGGV